MKTNFEILIQILKKPTTKRSSNDIKHLITNTENIDFFRNLVEKNGSDTLFKLCGLLEYEFCPQSNVLFSYGMKGTRFYIILQGSISVLIPTLKQRFEGSPGNINGSPRNINGNKLKFEPISTTLRYKANEKQKTPLLRPESMILSKNELELTEIKELRSGDSLGELALISNKPRASTIVCKEDCHFAYLEKAGFEAVLMELEKKKLNEGLSFLSKISTFANLRPKSLMNFYYGFQSKRYQKSQIVYKSYNKPEYVYIIKEGQFMLFKEIKKKAAHNPNIYVKDTIKIAVLNKGEIIGDEELDYEANEKQLREFSMICESIEGELLELNIEDYKKNLKTDQKSYQNAIVDSENKRNRYNKRIFEYFMFISNGSNNKNSMINAMKSRDKLKELMNKDTNNNNDNDNMINNNSFQKIRKDVNIFKKKQSELKNCKKLKNLRLFSKLNEIEEVYDNMDTRRFSTYSYNSSLMGKYKEQLDTIGRTHFSDVSKLKSLSIDLTDNPLLLKNISFFSPKYTRIVNIINNGTISHSRENTKNFPIILKK